MKEKSIVFNVNNWRSLCERLATSASNSCGLSHDIYVKKYSSDIYLEIICIDEKYRLAAIEVAREWDYATPEEIEDSDSSNIENGLCKHGLDLNCCPAGCGDLEDL